jgi:hypothetical protein
MNTVAQKDSTTKIQKRQDDAILATTLKAGRLVQQDKPTHAFATT